MFAEFEMQKVDPKSPTWRLVRAAMETRIVEAHKRLEAPQPMESTERLRGEIAALRALINRFEPPAEAPPSRMKSKGPLY